MTYGLGVDVGTTFTAAAVCRSNATKMVILGQHSVLTPSVVFADDDGSLLAGDAADLRAASGPSRVAREFKRRMGDPTPHVLGGVPYSTAYLIAALVRDAVRAASDAENGPPAEVVLTHPAIWGPYRREQFSEVRVLSGLGSARITSEPEAVATHLSLAEAIPEGAVVAVYDLGGGTFDATLLRIGRTGYEVLGTPDGVDRAGGLDFDDVVFHYIDEVTGGAASALDPQEPVEATALGRLRRECVAAKEVLSGAPHVRIPVVLPGGHLDVELSRAEFEQRIRPVLDSTLNALHRTISSARLEPAMLAEVILTGGSSRVPLVSELLAADLGRPIRSSRHPKHAVALGAARIAYRHSGASGGSASGARVVIPTVAGMAPTALPSTTRTTRTAAGRRHATAPRAGAGRWSTTVAAAAASATLLAGTVILARPGPPADGSVGATDGSLADRDLGSSPMSASAPGSASASAAASPSLSADRAPAPPVGPDPTGRTSDPAPSRPASPQASASTPPPPPAPTVLLSQRRPVIASSTEQLEFPPSDAVDGDHNTRWSSTFSVPQWLQVDLGGPRRLTRVTLDWQREAYATVYQIRTSLDGSSWQTVFSTLDGRGGFEPVDVDVVGRYVRMDASQRANEYGCSLWEMSVYGNTSPAD